MRTVDVYTNLKNWNAWDWEAYRMSKAEATACMEALSKQIPMKPQKHQAGDICPREDCIGILTDDTGWRADYCPDCGQRIKWE